MTSSSKDSALRAHYRLSGSSAHRWVNCFGSIALSESVPPIPPGPEAIKGTHIHDISEMALHDFLEHKLYGTDPEIRFDLLSQTEEFFETAKAYRDKMWEKAFEFSLTGKVFGLEETFLIDKDLHMGGILDLWLIYRDDHGKLTGFVGDLKTGYHYVPVKKNSQLAFYAVALRTFAASQGKTLDRVRTAIFQPKTEAEPYREHILSSKQLDVWEKKFFTGAHQILVKKSTKYKVGAWCEFCPGRAICPAYSKSISEKTSLKLIDPETVVLPDPKTLPDETILKLVLHGDSLTDWKSVV